ncbi:MAG: proton-dependent oligopeptide transporter, family [Sphingomonadales bacterium]|jgi:POT family proton-dependent oligopeptide transporter|nr:proton-dependent oligopeptide transporter, family [Sphingomonadales bacterium]
MTVAEANPVRDSDDRPADPVDRAFLGHPKGLGYLAFAEGFERFSYYGMQALLVLYMTKQLLLPGHVENVAGFKPFRAAIEWAYGPLTPLALASAIFGLYAGLVYLTPIAGGVVADRLLGRTKTITIGALLMAAGHFLMAFDVSFLLALFCLLLGVGCFKGNIATQVGELYAPGDLRRADAFQIFLLAVNIAVIISPLVCGTLGQRVAWHWGFGAAGVGMLIGLAVYLYGRRWLPVEAAPRARASQKDAPPAHPPLVPGDGKRVAVLVLLIPLLILSAVGNQQIFNSYLVWGDANYNLAFFGQTMPVTWLISIDAFISTGTIFLSLLFWRWWSKRRREPDEITKLTIGTVVSALAPLTLAAASWHAAATGQKVGLGWGIAFHVINDIGFANVFPVGIALFSRAAPRAIGGMMIGVYYLHLFACNMLVGWLGGLLEKMPAANFWLLHAGLVAAAAVGLLLVRSRAGRILAPGDPEAKPSPAA